MKNVDPRDPKWTAYILNELDDPTAREVEREVETNPEARAIVESIRATTGLIKTAFAAEPDVTLDKAQRERVEQAATRSAGGRVIRFPVWAPVVLSAAAALVVAVLGVRQYHQFRDAWEQDVLPAPTVKQAVAVTETVGQHTSAPTEAEAFKPDGEVELLSDTDWTASLLVEYGSDQELAYRASDAREVSLRRSNAKPMSASPHRYMVMSGMPGRQVAQFRFDPGMDSSKSFMAPPSGIISPSLDDFGELRPNAFQRVVDHPLSTFSIDVDTASYSVVRKLLNDGQLPPADAVRIEELVNYFSYDYPAPTNQTPFAARMEVAPAPWRTNHYLVRVALKGREIPSAERPSLNLTYLIDVSGSMSDRNRLPLVKRALQALVNRLDERDRVAVVVYAGAAGLVLPPTSGARPKEIIEALERLEAGGSTAGGAGIQLAYQTAREQFHSNAVNRVILCTDGDFNVGITRRDELERLIEQEAKSGVFLTVLGFGMGNYKDTTLELLSNKGNGNYGYIDNFSEARKVLVDQMLGTLVTIAKDVKIQVEFNPAYVEAYKLIGYENRMLKKEDFNNDKVDAGDIGAGHTVTAFYEVVPAGQPVPDVPAVDALKYQQTATAADKPPVGEGEILTLKLRYKEPDGVTSRKLEFVLDTGVIEYMDPSLDFRFASAVAGFGMLLRGEEVDAGFAMKDVLRIAENSTGADSLGYRAEFIFQVLNAMILRP